MKFLHRVTFYAVITAIIEVPSILILYSFGYPESPSSDWWGIFWIVENVYMWFIWGYAIGGPVPGQGPRDTSFDLFWGIVSMFIVIAVIGETMNWLIGEIRRLKRTLKPPWQSDSSKSSETIPAALETLGNDQAFST